MRSTYLTFILLFVSVLPLCSQSKTSAELFENLKLQKGKDKVATLIELSWLHYNVGLDSAFSYADQARTLAGQVGDKNSMASSYFATGYLNSIHGENELGIEPIRKGLALAEDLDSDLLRTEGFSQLSRCYVRLNRMDSGRVFAQNALTLAQNAGSRSAEAKALTALGYAHFFASSFEKAIQHFLEALSINEEINDTRAAAYNHSIMGSTYLSTGDYVDAFESFNRSMEINSANGDGYSVAGNLMRIGVSYQKQGLQAKAQEYYQQVLPIAEKNNYGSLLGLTLSNIGSSMVDQGKVEEGLVYIYGTLELQRSFKDYINAIHTINDISYAKLKLNDGAGAKASAEEAIALAKEYSDIDMQRYGYLNLSKSYVLLGDFEKAYEARLSYEAVKDSIFNDQTDRRLEELQIQYETEKQNLEIATLQNDKTLEENRRNNYLLLGLVVLVIAIAMYSQQRLKAKRNEQLLQKERDVDRLKSDFFANISHEFRTPLSLILAPIASMLDKTQDPNDRYQLSLMQKSAARLLRLINQILDLAKAEFGELRLMAEKTDVSAIVRGVVATFESLTESKDIDLVINVSDIQTNFYADVNKLETIVINLVSNAIKFSKPGDQVTVSLNETLEASPTYAQGSVELKVIDTGVGLSTEELDNIFDRYYQAGSSREERHEGTGIGLALTRELIILHGGNIEVSSELGKGTIVAVRFPIGKDHLSADQISQGEAADQSIGTSNELLNLEYTVSQSRAIAESTIGDSRSSILLIEDNDDVRQYVKSILMEEYSVVEAVDGVQGVGLAKELMPDLIISDVMMPNMNGYDTCKTIKQDEHTSHIPFILLTAKASLDSRLEGLEMEADLYLKKPFAPKELKLSIRNLIESRKKLRDRYNRRAILQPAEIAVTSVDEQFLDRLMKILEDNHADETFDVEQMSREAGMSRSQLHRKLKALTNESASQFLRSFRLRRAMQLLKSEHASVSEIAYKVGFSSHSYFNKCFQELYNTTPSSILSSTSSD